MSHSVLQMIRDFVLAPALLDASLVSILGAFAYLMAIRKTGAKAGASATVTAFAFLAAFLLTALDLVAFGAAVVRLDLPWLRWISYLGIALIWSGFVAWRTEALASTRWAFAACAGAFLGVAGWAMDAYVVTALLFVE